MAPIFKKEERYRAENYGPISLTSIPCEVMEHIIVSAVRDFSEQQNILHPEQHGFRRGHACESQLLGFVDEAAELWREAARWMLQKHWSECVTTSLSTNFVTMEYQASG